MKHRYPRLILAALVVVSVVLAFGLASGRITGRFLAQDSGAVSSLASDGDDGGYTSQKSFDLDLNEKLFRYEQEQFNDSKRYAVHEWTEEENKTVWINIPRNSTIVNSSLKVTGQMFVNGTLVDQGESFFEIAVGDVASNSGNEIAVSSLDIPENLYLLTNNMGRLWHKNLLGMTNGQTVDIGGATTGQGNVVVIGGDGEIGAVDGSKNTVWNRSMGTIESLSIGNLTTDTRDEIFVVGPNIHQVINATGDLVFNQTLEKESYSAEVGVVDSNPNVNEIAVGRENNEVEVYRYNETGESLEDVCNFTGNNNYNIGGISIGNLTDDPGNEIAAADVGGNVYILNSSCHEKAKFSGMEYGARDLDVGDLVNHIPGDEVLVATGHDDKAQGRAYVFDSSLSLINSFELDERARGAVIENVTPLAPGGSNINEGILSTRNGSLYQLDYDAFPTNLTLEIGGNLTWQYMQGEEVDDGRFRESKVINDTNTNISEAFQNYIDDAEGEYVDIPATMILFSSDYRGRLNITNLNVTYDYDASPNIHNETISYWSQTQNIVVNQSIVNESVNISFTEPAVDIEIDSVSVPGGAGRCGFTDREYTVEGDYCDVENFTVDSSSSHGPVYLWHDELQSSVPVFRNSTGFLETEQVNEYTLHRNVTVVDETGDVDQDFRNITVNVSVENDSIVENEFLEVKRDGEWHDITPQETANCSSDPQYTKEEAANDTFYVCKQVDESKENLFRWKQPDLPSVTKYRAGGYTNHRPRLENKTVNPGENIWGEEFNFTVSVTDEDGERVNVTLLVDVNKTGWERFGTETVDADSTRKEANFNVSSDKMWAGNNNYTFEYVNYNETGGETENYYKLNSSIGDGPKALKHNITVQEVQGNGTFVNRTNGTYFEVFVQDDEEGYVGVDEGVDTYFWVTEDGAEWDSGYINSTNASGYANYTFSPDENYTVGEQWWKAGVLSDRYYRSPENSTNFTVEVNGRVYIDFVEPEAGSVEYRNETKYLEARLLDQYGRAVEVSGYNCSFWQNGSSVYNESVTNSSGFCFYPWPSNCSLERGPYRINATLWGNGSDFYYIEGEGDSSLIDIWDRLNLTVDSPSSGEIYHKNETLSLNSRVNDTCFLCSPSDYNVSWELNYYKGLRVDLQEKFGLNRTDEPYSLNGSYLRQLGVDIDHLEVNSTKVLRDGDEIPVDVRPWEDSSRSGLDYSKEHWDDNTQLVFLNNLSSGSEASYWVTWNETNPQPKNVISYIRNGGFEGNDLSGWEYTDGTPGSSDYDDYVFTENDSPSENYSAHLLAYTNTVFLNQTFRGSEPTVKVRYKAWGQYNDSSYVKIGSPGNYCSLELDMNRLSRSEATWNKTNCSLSSDKVSIVVNDEGNEDYNEGASHLMIDEICLTDGDSGCLNLQSGAPLAENITFKENIVPDSHDASWQVPEEEVGNRRMFTEAYGNYYKDDPEKTDFLLYGWSNLTRASIESDYCAYDDESENWVCGVNASLGIECWVHDKDSSEPVEDYNVSFYNDTARLNDNETQASGRGVYWLEGPSEAPKLYNYSCNITDQSTVFYNSTEHNEKNVSIYVTSGDTTGELFREPESDTATDITRLDSYVLPLNLTLENTGDGNMYSPRFNFSNVSGIHYSETDCSPIKTGQNCSETVDVTVGQTADTGEKTINITAIWDNADGSQGNVTRNMTLYVQNNTALNITQSHRREVRSAGFEGQMTSFTVESFGNTELEDVGLSLSGANSSALKNWTQFDPSNISLIDKADNRTVVLNGSIPADTQSGTYVANITANATNSSCSPQDSCSDSLLFNLTVSEPDWYRVPEDMNETIGSGVTNGTIGTIEVTSNLDVNQTFDVTVSGNGSKYGYIRTGKSNFSLSNESSEEISVFHNRSSDIYSSGTYTSNITIQNLNGSIPGQINTTVVLKIVDLTVDILQPTSSEIAGPLNASEGIDVRANVTKPGKIIEENMTFDVLVGGERCENMTSVSEPSLNDPYWHWTCSAPEIPRNPINNSIVVKGTHAGPPTISSRGEEEDAVTYYDVVPPVFSRVGADPIQYDPARDYRLIEMNITDNTEVDDAWIGIDTPEPGTVNISQYSRNGPDNRTFVFNLTADRLDVGQFPVGDYDITVYANDTGGKNGYGGKVNSTKGWFDVYEPVDVLGDMTAPTGENISANFTLYREDRSFWPYPIDKFSTSSGEGKFNWTAHRRSYDLEVEMFGHEARFESLDINESSAGMTNFERPFSFDYLPNSSAGNNSIRITPNEFKNPLLGLVVEENENLTFSGKTVTLDFSDKDLSGIDNKNNLRVLACEEWAYESRDCNQTLSGEDMLNATPDASSNTLTFTSEGGGTGYILAEACISDGGLIDCSGYYEPPEEEDEDDDSTGGGGSIPEEEPPFPFELDSNIDSSRLFPGETVSYWLMVTNKLEEDLEVNVSTAGSMGEWMELGNSSLTLGSKESETLDIGLTVPEGTDPGTYSDSLVISARDRQKTIPLEAEVNERGESALSLSVELLDSEIYMDESLQTKVTMESKGEKEEFDVNLTYIIKDSENKTVREATENVSFERVYTDIKEMELEEEVEAGKHRLILWAEFEDKAVRDMVTFQIMQQFWASTAGQLLLFLGVPIALLAIIISGVHLSGKYKDWKEAKKEEQRYLFPVDDDSIPQKGEDSFWIGKLAGGDKKAYYNSDDLKTHVLVAGATGAGKSVGASVFAEEALDQDIPVVVFDPTAQWTGFVNQCEDEDLLNHYSHHGMDKKKRRSYPGMIHKMDDPERDIDFEEITEEGEITVFTLNELSTEEFDKAVRNIIDSMFDINWEESEDLKLVVVFDEVHRLLEKYGGKGGYEALERACREFRKWGIGIIMCSQVLADFKEAVEGNVLTDVQFNTKAIKDIRKAKDKYGEKYAKRITRQGIGVCMMQHAQYNDGDPWFVRFRPTWHNPHKLKEEELEKYEKFAEKLEEIEERIDKMDEKGKDVFDMRTSLRMAKNKLKSGNFRMTEIYINSLEDKL